MKISAVCFDLGKVLVDFDYSIAAGKVAARCSKPPENLHAFLGSSPLLVEYESGRLTRAQFFAAVRDAAGFQGDVVEFGKFFAEIFSPIEPMIALHAESKMMRVFIDPAGTQLLGHLGRSDIARLLNDLFKCDRT